MRKLLCCWPARSPSPSPEPVPLAALPPTHAPDPLIARGVLVPARHLPEAKANRFVLAERHRSRPPARFDPGTPEQRARVRELESSVCMDAPAVPRKLAQHVAAARDTGDLFDNSGWLPAAHPAIEAAVAAGHDGTGLIDVFADRPPRADQQVAIDWHRMPQAGAVIVSSAGRVRRVNEDRAFATAPARIAVGQVAHEVRLMGLFDGHGGAANAHAACRDFPGHLQAAFELLGSDQWAPLDFWRAFKAASVWTSHGLPAPGGTTALTAAVHGDELWVAQAGDLFAVGDLGQGLVRLAREQHADDARIERSNANRGNQTVDGRVGGKLGPGRAWGHHGLPASVNERPTLTRFDLPPPDQRAGCFIVLGSDGLCELDAASPMQVGAHIRRRLAEGVPAEQAGAEAILATLRAEPHGRDNLSCLIVDLASPRGAG